MFGPSRDRADLNIGSGIRRMAEMRRKALAGAVAAIAVLAGQVWAESPRPKPRPDVMVPASALIAPQATPQIATQITPMARPAAKGMIDPIVGPEEDTPEIAAPSAVRPAVVAPRDPGFGAVTNLPLPRYVTLKTKEGNARRGPGLTHRIDWVFTRAGMPLKITAEYGHWRRIEDADGIGGWIHYSLLSGVRSVLVKADLLDIFSAPRPDSSILFRAEGGVIAKILECANDWCRISVEGEKGWAPSAALWGVDPGEVLE